ncbi:MAG: hypothetical protein H6766_04485 [Candidatus Peribacteria bacterium]|nr:MAG: hypothetical protein H6766_04485 [Candidatus Peribacteria bacterium]
MIDEFTLDSTDPQMAFLSMMVEGFRDQRIMVDSAMTGTNVSMPDTTAQVKTILTNLQMTLNQLDSYNLLQNMGQTTYEGDIAFAVITNTDALEQAITDIITGTVFNEEWEGIQGMPALSGYLIVHTADDYELLLTHEMTTISLQRDMMQIVAKQDGNQLIITLTRNTKHTAELSILVTQAEQTTLE